MIVGYFCQIDVSNDEIDEKYQKERRFVSENYEIDNVDRKIMSILQQDARTPYLEIARKLIVSGGTIHQRINKLTELGIIEGSKILVNKRLLGRDVTVLVGIHLRSAKGNQKIVERLKKHPEVIEAHFTTGAYALMIKICVSNIKEFHTFLVEKVQAMEDIQSTESFICMDSPIERDIKL